MPEFVARRTGRYRSWCSIGRTSSIPSEATAASDGSRSSEIQDSVSSRLTFVTVMKTADLRERDHATATRYGDWARDGCVLVQRQLNSGPFVILNVGRHDAMQAARVEDDDVVKTFAADGCDPALEQLGFPDTATTSS